MPAAAPAPRPQAPEGGGGLPPERLRLVRQSHIFAAAVREVLETRLLREVSPVALTLSQLHLLKLMCLNGAHQVGDVADFLGVSPPAATKNIDKLEALGLMSRAPSKGDRRATLLTVSPKGRALVRQYERRKAARLTPVFDRFRPDEVELLARLLERFALSLLDKELSEDGDGVCLRCDAYLEAGCQIGLLRGGCPYQTTRRGRHAAASGGVPADA